jgi:hypothetical protein
MYMKTASIALLLATAGLISDAAAAWPRLPSAGSQPVDLASKAIPGTVIKSSQGIGEPQSFLSTDPVAGATVPVGASEVVISLAKQYVVNTARFLNDGMEGKVTVSGSPDAANWTGLGQVEISAADRSVPISFAGVQVKYVKFGFQSAKNGMIRNVSVFGGAKAKDFHLKFTESSNAAGINLADGVGGARAIYAFPTPNNIGEPDAATNVFEFPQSADRYRTVVFDLGSTRPLKQFSAAYSAMPVRLEVFAFEQLPEQKDWRGKLTFDPAILDRIKPVATGEDARGLGNIKLTPSKTVRAQYVALRFEPGFSRSASTGNGAVENLVNFVLGVSGESRLIATPSGGFNCFGIGLTAQGSGNYESTSQEQGDENEESSEEENDGPIGEVKGDFASPWPPSFYTNSFNSFTGSRGGGGGIGGFFGGDSDDDDNSGTPPIIIINPPSSPPPPGPPAETDV